MTNQAQMKVEQAHKGFVYCPMCTHTVEADVVTGRKSAHVRPGQKCPRCNASLDAGYIMRYDRAA